MLKLLYDKLEDIPEPFRPLFKLDETTKKYKLTEVEGLKSQEDVDRQLTANQRERDEHKATKLKLKEADDKLKLYGDLAPDDVHAKLDRLVELEAVSGGKIDETKINAIVEQRIKQRTTPLERDNAKLKTDLAEAQGKVTELGNTINSTKIGDAIRKVAVDAKVLPAAMDDLISLGAGQFEVKDDGTVIHKQTGIDAKAWLNDQKASRAYFWPLSKGAGAQGGDEKQFGTNPWSRENWNVTEQGKIVQAKGAEHGRTMAKQAGVELGAIEPAPKAAAAA